MVKIFEKTQQLDNINNYQSRIIEHESFEEYLKSINLLKECYIYHEYINHDRQVITFMLEIEIRERKIKFIHYAEVIDIYKGDE